MTYGMRYYLCLAILVVCEAARIPRVTEQPYFPNFQDIYPNRNYQTESVNNHDDGPFFENYRAHEGNAGIGNEFYDHRTPIGGRANFLHHLTRVPFEEFRGRDAVPRHYDRFNHAINYDYQL
ncbi:uncharacterized protein LOC122571027 isoform X2 [Bombus pyrosoma]|uniref:uncharacterized protein LOC122571027 isoform X2 n=1 Tax=Bombus pyrosoma TaxID=396416 RepID=UPI001CB920E3|nr:uncharacterized protein LOC122571027 isoform X2 [Bombus pyrosoma]